MPAAAAPPPPPAARRHAGPGRPVLDAARIGPGQIADELGGLSPGKLHAAELAADALARALGAAVRERAERPRIDRHEDPRRHERRGGQRGGGAPVRSGGRDRRGHARAVVGPRERRRAQLLLGLRGRPGPLDGPRDGAPAFHARPARGVPRRAWSSRSSRDSPPARPRIRASAATATCAWTRCSTWPTVLVAPGWPPATTRAPRRSTDDDGPLLRVAADPAKDQTYMLAALVASVAGPDAFPARRADQARGQGDRRAGRAAGGEQGRLAGPLLPGRHRPRPLPGPPRRHRSDAPGPIVDRDGDVRRPPRGQHRFTVGQRRGLGIARPASRSTCSTRTRHQPGDRRPSRGARYQARVRSAHARLHRDGARVDRVKLRYRSRPLPCRIAGEPRPRAAHRAADPRALRAGRRRRARAAGLSDGRRRGGGVGDDRPVAADAAATGP